MDLDQIKQIFPFIQSIIAILLIIFILLQQRGTALGSAFGGEGGFYSTLKGIQKKVFWITCILGFLFILFGILNLFISQ